MTFGKTITVDQLGSKDDPKRTKWNLKAGILRRIKISLPSGSCGLMGISVFYYDTQIFPFDRGEYFTGNNVFFEGKIDQEIKEENTELSIQYYNSDILYPHEFTISAEVDMQDEGLFEQVIAMSLQQIIALLTENVKAIKEDKYKWLEENK